MAESVWLLATTFEPRGRSLYTLRLALELGRHGFTPKILCRSAEGIPSRLRDQVDVEARPLLARPLLDRLSIRSLLAAHTATPPALIHAQRRTAAHAGAALATAFNVPYLLTIHDEQTGDRIWSPSSRRPDRVIAVSPSVRLDLISRTGLADDRVRVIASGVEVPELPVLPVPRSADRLPVVVCAGALEPERGVMVFLMAAELILSSGQEVEFLVIGKGPDERPLRAAARHLEITHRVTFVDYFVEYGELLEVADVFVVPSLEQGLGTVMLEAMALGKPVVATKVGGIADYLTDGVHACLVPKGDHVRLAERIQELLDTPTRARRLATAGQQLVRERFTMERMAEETAALYRELLAERSAASPPTLPMRT
jgi:glycosyltransferase involved in cell wall biosynthesis